MIKVLFVAGDLSGDVHAARVAQALRGLRNDVQILAVGGPALRVAANRFVLDLVENSVMGFWEPLKRLPWFRRALNDVIKPVLKNEKPDVVVPVDFFGFNRFVARAAKDAGARVLYFISPQVWASRPWRVKHIKSAVDKIMVIFPFETAFYEERGVPAVFVGHPLLDALPPVPAEAPVREAPVVGLLPGSRAGEVRRHLPLFLDAARRIAQRHPKARFVLFAARSLSDAFYTDLAGNGPSLNLEIIRDENYARRAGLDVALTVSGTATLENALLGIPMVVAYTTSWPTYWLARALVRVGHIAMPNLLAGRTVVPELIQSAATAENLSSAAAQFLDDPARRGAVREELLALRGRLGGPGAARRAAEQILAAAGVGGSALSNAEARA